MDASLLVVVFWLLGTFVSCLLLYCVIRLAIRHALREARLEERTAHLAALQSPPPYVAPPRQ